MNGLGLLLNQARLAFEMWFGVRPEITPELLKAIEAMVRTHSLEHRRLARYRANHRIAVLTPTLN